MKIAVVSQRYHWESFSVVRSILENIGTEKDVVRWYEKKYIYDSFEPDIVFCLGANSKYEGRGPTVGIGFSDPNLFDLERVKKFDLYFTSDYRIHQKHGFPWLPCFSDFRYFHKIPYTKEYEITFIGGGPHPIIKNRIETVDKLRERFNLASISIAGGTKIHCFGDGWPKHENNHKFIQGDELIKVINQSKIILDITNAEAPISSRIFQAAACGVPVVTFYREDIFELFEDCLIYYRDYNELCDVLNEDSGYCSLMAKKILLCYKNRNDIRHRINRMWKVIHDKNIL